MTGWLRRIAWRFRALAGRSHLERDLDEELRLHIELETEDLARTHGLAPDEARRRALVAFGGVERFKDEHRDARGVRWIEELARDVRYAVRALRRSPVYTLSTVLVLALGIGASTAVFSAVDAVLLRALPYPDPDRLVRIGEWNPSSGHWGASVADLRGIETQARSLEAVGARQAGELGVSFGGEARRMRAGRVTAGFLRALGIRASHGRLLQPNDDVPGAAPVVVVGHALAMKEFGSVAGALERTVTIDGLAHTVVGVLPAGVDDLGGLRAQLWPALQLPAPTRRGPFGLMILARMRPDATLETTRSELATVSARLRAQWSDFPDRTARLVPVPLREAILGGARGTLAVFIVAVALVMLIAVANVASLTLVRTVGRWREVAVRTALGASRARLVRLLLTESMVLALAGALLGVALGALGLRVISVVGGGIARIDTARLDLHAALFAVGVALLSGAVVGAYPVALLLRGGPAAGVGEGARGASAGRRTHSLRGAFVVAQFALALPLLAGAGLLLNSFVRLQRVVPGFEAGHLLTLRVSLPSARYPADSAVRGFWAHALPRVREVPGVRAAALGSAMPPNDPGVCCDNFDLIAHPVAPGGGQPTTPFAVVSPEYFAALGIPLLEGRSFTPTDTGGAFVSIVSRAWARRFFPEGNVVGRQYIQGGCTECGRTTIVGVVDDVKYTGLGQPGVVMYSPLTEGWPNTRSLVLFVRTAPPPREVIGGVQSALHSVDPGLPLDDVAPMAERLSSSIDAPRHLASLVGGFAAAAMLLAAVGIFGMLSYVVSARRREIGVRMALGAGRRSVVAMIVGRGMRHALIGAAIGLIATIALTRRLADALFEVRATDPWTLASMTALLLSVALLASWLPARRAASIHPIDAIREE